MEGHNAWSYITSGKNEMAQGAVREFLAVPRATLCHFRSLTRSDVMLQLVSWGGVFFLAALPIQFGQT